MLIRLQDRKVALVEVAKRHVRPAGKGWPYGFGRRLDMKESTKSSELSFGEVLWALVTIGSVVALFLCLAR